MFVLFVQNHKVPLIKYALLVCKCPLKHNRGFIATVGMGRRLAARYQFLQNDPLVLAGKLVGNVEHTHVRKLTFPGQRIDVIPEQFL